MPINDPRVQIATALPPLDLVSTRKGTTFRAPIIDVFHSRRMAYLKLLKLEDIAREALCAVLARVVGLPIKQAFYVYVDPAIVPGHLTGNTENIAFGLERDFYSVFSIANSQIDDEILRWPEALACAVFDEWVVNGDRLPKNLLFAKNGVYWIIDHDEALPNSAQAHDLGGSQILQVLRKGKSELELHRLKRDALDIVQRFQRVDWDQLLELLIPPDLKTSNIVQYFEKHIEFLTHRIEYMPDILTRSLDIKQLDMKLDDHTATLNNWDKKR